MIFGKLDLDFAVLRADRSGVVVGHVDAAGRRADIVNEGREFVGRNDLADRFFDLRELLRRLFDAGSDAHACMHQDLSGVDGGEEIPAKERRQRKGRNHDRQKAAHETQPVTERENKQLAIDPAELLEPPLETALHSHQRIA